LVVLLLLLQVVGTLVDAATDHTRPGVRVIKLCISLFLKVGKNQIKGPLKFIQASLICRR
jgi:hypothetical protein